MKTDLVLESSLLQQRGFTVGNAKLDAEQRISRVANGHEADLLLRESTAAGAYQELTVVIPTLNEANSIGILLDCLAESLPGVTLIVADDNSSDGTADAVERSASRMQKLEVDVNIQLLRRKNPPVRGLSASVVDACYACKTKYMIVMDGDLQHPPEMVPVLFDELKRGARVVVACRAGLAGKFSFRRMLMTQTATIVARVRLMVSGLQTKDPLTGFFGVYTEDLRQVAARGRDRIQLSGYKILFDFLKLAPQILSKKKNGDVPRRWSESNRFCVREVYFIFGRRTHGYSKLRFSHLFSFARSLVS